MKIAGIEIPKRLEFGNEEHINIVRTVERRLDLLDEGIKCPWCGKRMRPSVNYEGQIIEWSCGGCEESFWTNLEGE